MYALIAFIIIVVFLLIVLFIIVLLTSSSTGVKYLPTIPNGFVTPIKLDEIKAIPQKFAYTVYLPLANVEKINSFEDEAIITLSVMTTRAVKDVFSAPIPDDISLFLSSIGTVKWVSPSGTLLVLEAGDNFFDYFADQNPNWVIFQYPGTGFNSIASLNKYLELPYNLIFKYLNICDDSGDKKSIIEWNSEIKGLNRSVQSYCLNFNDLTPFLSPSVPSTVGLPIGLVQFQNLPVTIPRKFAEYQNRVHGTTYSEDHFLDLTTNLCFKEDMSYQEIPFDNGGFNELNIEVSLDVVAAYSTRPNAGVWCVNGTLTNNSVESGNYNEYQMYNFDFLPIIWRCSEIDNSPKVWSASYGALSVYPNEYQRISLETRLLSLCGYSLFHSSGDQGPWMLTNYMTSSEKYDVLRPDGVSTPFTGDGAVTVGGFDYNPGQYFDTYWPMSFIGGDLEIIYPNIFSSAGGFYRGLPNPDWKKEAASEYINKEHYNSVRQYVKESGEIGTIENIQIEQNGAIYPDLVCIGKMCLPGVFSDSPDDKLNAMAAGSSIASPVLASEICTLVDRFGPIPSISKFLYSNRKSIIDRIQIGRNGIYNYLGYVSDKKFAWDPVQGLGVLNYQNIEDMLK